MSKQRDKLKALRDWLSWNLSWLFLSYYFLRFLLLPTVRATEFGRYLVENYPMPPVYASLEWVWWQDDINWVISAYEWANWLTGYVVQGSLSEHWTLGFFSVERFRLRERSFYNDLQSGLKSLFEEKICWNFGKVFKETYTDLTDSMAETFEYLVSKSKTSSYVPEEPVSNEPTSSVMPLVLADNTTLALVSSFSGLPVDIASAEKRVDQLIAYADSIDLSKLCYANLDTTFRLPGRGYLNALKQCKQLLVKYHPDKATMQGSDTVQAQVYTQRILALRERVYDIYRKGFRQRIIEHIRQEGLLAEQQLAQWIANNYRTSVTIALRKKNEEEAKRRFEASQQRLVVAQAQAQVVAEQRRFTYYRRVVITHRAQEEAIFYGDDEYLQSILAYIQRLSKHYNACVSDMEQVYASYKHKHGYQALFGDNDQQNYKVSQQTQDFMIQDALIVVYNRASLVLNRETLGWFYDKTNRMRANAIKRFALSEDHVRTFNDRIKQDRLDLKSFHELELTFFNPKITPRAHQNKITPAAGENMHEEPRAIFLI